MLIKSGANVNAKTKNHGKDDLTPMHLAVFASTPEFIELLAIHGVLINERESTKDIPLFSLLLCMVIKI
ncbi:hypothetical protein [Wolbachia pipientis]|uniref:hypothetical protein n=1 Tax=Wolbachia pipientis TaxID=955 RepID=UPI0025A4236C|nr:hypothetical protein [Wolbachia pipientis]MDM8335473.1 hypothetical protein [Wolbachia pipientis]